MAAGVIKGAMWAFLAFAFLSWILALIGLAGLQRNCYNMSNVLATNPSLSRLDTGAGAGSNPFSGFNPTWGLRGFNSNLQCSDVFRYYWFMFAMEFVTLVGLAVMAALGMLAASALSWMAWLTVLTVLFIQGADSFLALKDYAYSYGNALDFARLTSTGWILTALANLALIFLLGWRPRKLRQGQNGPLKY
eukprot:GHUV01004021.1.p1 GENE.GHUV01004021.1~~GHUV01004021.1.p1  ORF type:complete len:191 (+),score=50.07 GHUV01004021.1:199-771(+)